MTVKNKKTDKMVFKYHYNGLSEEEKSEVRNEFLKASELSNKLEEICNVKFAW